MSFSLSPQPLAQMQADLFSARMVGAAVGGGIVDDGPALRTAISSALSLGLTLYLPPGTYRVASWDPAYATGGERRCLNVATTTNGNQFKIVGNSATIVFDFPKGTYYTPDYLTTYETLGLVFDATAGSFSAPSVSGITFVAKNGPASVRAGIFTVGACDTGVCNIAGKSVTKTSGTGFTTYPMAGQCIAMGSLAISCEIWNPCWILGGVVNTVGTAVLLIGGTVGTKFTPALIGTSVLISGVPYLVSDVPTSNTLTLGTSAGNQSLVVLTSRIVYLPNGTCNTSNTGNTLTSTAGDQFNPSQVGAPIIVNGAANKVATYVSPTQITLSTAPGNLTGVAYAVGGRLFTSDMAARRIQINITAQFDVATVDASGLFLLLTGTPVLESQDFITPKTTVQMFPGAVVASVTDATHLTLNAPMGTATGVPYNFTRPTVGNMVIENCSFRDFHNDIVGGGYKTQTVRGWRSYSTHGYDGNYSGVPFVGIWSNSDYYTSYLGFVIISDWYFDGCTDDIDPAYKQGRDGALFLLGPAQVGPGTCIRHGFEAIQSLYNAAFGPGTPANLRQNTSYSAGIKIDGTPAAGATVKACVGYRIDASDVSITGIDVQGCPTAYQAAGPYRPNAFCVQLDNVISGGQITLPSSYENGVAIGTPISAYSVSGERGSFVSGVKIKVPADYTGALFANIIGTGPYSNNVTLADVTVNVPVKYAGAISLAAFQFQQTTGQVRMTNCRAIGADAGIQLGNIGDAADSPNLLLSNMEWRDCTINMSGNLTQMQADRQIVNWTPPDIGWYRLMFRLNLISARIEIYNTGIGGYNADTVVDISYSAYQANVPTGVFTQIRHSNFGVIIDQMRVSQQKSSAGYLQVDVHAAVSGVPVSIALLSNNLDRAVIFDPPFQFATLNASVLAGDTIFPVSSFNGVQLGQEMQIGTEQVGVPYRFGTPLSGQFLITRGINGTAATSHLAGDQFAIFEGDFSAYCTFQSGMHIDKVSIEGSRQIVTARHTALPNEILSVLAPVGAESDFEIVALGDNGAGCWLISRASSTRATDNGWLAHSANNNGDFTIYKLASGVATESFRLIGGLVVAASGYRTGGAAGLTITDNPIVAVSFTLTTLNYTAGPTAQTICTGGGSTSTSSGFTGGLRT